MKTRESAPKTADESGKSATTSLKVNIGEENDQFELAQKELQASLARISELETELEKKDRYAQLFIDKMLNGFSRIKIITDDYGQPVDMKMTVVNDAFFRSTGLRREEVIDVPVSTYFPEILTMQPDLLREAEKVALDGKSSRGEAYFKSLGKWFEISAYCVKTGFVNVIYRDITQRKAAEKELEKSKAYLENSLNSAPDGILLLDTDLRINFVNATFVNLFKFQVDQLLGKRILELDPNNVSRRKSRWIHKRLCELLHTGQDLVVRETELAGIDGDTVPINISASPIRDNRNKVVGAILFVRNIAEQKRIQKMVIQTEKMMSIGGMASGIAHEINNPLGGMLQGAQNIIRRLSPDLASNRKLAEEIGIDLSKMSLYIEQRQIMRMIEGIIGAGKKAAQIISGMLQFSRQSESKHVPTDFPQLMDEAIELCAHDYSPMANYDFKKIRIVKEYADRLPLVSCARNEIEQVILNLLQNAAQAMFQRDNDTFPRLILRIQPEDSAIRIEIQDNGPGLDSGLQSRVFDPFFTTKPAGEGTGLGLAVSRMIITNNHNGTLEVISEPGQGACFVIRLPV